jgi:hypothetical protein
MICSLSLLIINFFKFEVMVIIMKGSSHDIQYLQAYQMWSLSFSMTTIREEMPTWQGSFLVQISNTWPEGKAKGFCVDWQWGFTSTCDEHIVAIGGDEHTLVFIIKKN